MGEYEDNMALFSELENTDWSKATSNPRAWYTSGGGYAEYDQGSRLFGAESPSAVPSATTNNYGSWSPEEVARTKAYNARSTGSSLGLNQNYGGNTRSGYATPSKGPIFGNQFTKTYASLFNPDNLPSFKAMPTLNYTKLDEGAARKVGYSHAAPYISQLRNTVNRAVTRALAMPSSPGQSLMARNIIGEAGTGIDKAQATGAQYGYETEMAKTRLANDAEARQYAADVSATQYENQSMQNRYNMTYQAALNDWIRSQG